MQNQENWNTWTEQWMTAMPWKILYFQSQSGKKSRGEGGNKCFFFNFYFTTCHHVILHNNAQENKWKCWNATGYHLWKLRQRYCSITDYNATSLFSIKHRKQTTNCTNPFEGAINTIKILGGRNFLTEDGNQKHGNFVYAWWLSINRLTAPPSAMARPAILSSRDRSIADYS